LAKGGENFSPRIIIIGFRSIVYPEKDTNPNVYCVYRKIMEAGNTKEFNENP